VGHPQRPIPNPSDRRLAVTVPDHPVDYIGFEGIIPTGEYGAGPVVVWDRGTYRSTTAGVRRVSSGPVSSPSY
jgi:DNA ligase D-like protein (predicted 3'-phosphoesterase)